MTKLEEKLKENHKIKTRVMLWYVRDYLMLEETRKSFDTLLHSVDNWKSQLSSEDIMVADMLIKGGIDLDTILEFQDKCYVEKKYHSGGVI